MNSMISGYGRYKSKYCSSWVVNPMLIILDYTFVNHSPSQNCCYPRGCLDSIHQRLVDFLWPASDLSGVVW